MIPTRPEAVTEVMRLKQSWRKDPSWILEDTKGFESHREELQAYRHKWEAIWDREHQAVLLKKSALLGLPGNTTLARYVLQLENRVAQLEKLLSEKER